MAVTWSSVTNVGPTYEPVSGIEVFLVTTSLKIKSNKLMNNVAGKL